MLNILIFILALALVFKSADSALKYSSRVAEALGLSKGTVGFLLIAIISALPETFISALSAVQGNPSMGLGTLFGSNVADLTLVLAIVCFTAGRSIKVESHVLKNMWLFLGLLGFALLLGLDNFYTRWEGLALIVGGVLFHLYVLKQGQTETYGVKVKFSFQNFLALLLSMAFLLLGAHYAVDSAVNIAEILDIKPALIGMFLIALGTTLPELFFSIKAVRQKEDGLALGDVLGTVLTDATIVVGIVAMIQPFAFDARIVYSTGMIMLLCACVLFYLMVTGKRLSRKEAILLVLIYVLFAVVEWSL